MAVLIVSNSQDAHAIHVLKAMRARKILAYQLNTEDYPLKEGAQVTIKDGLYLSELIIGQECVSTNQITSVWWRRPLPHVVDPRIEDPDVRTFTQDECQRLVKGLILGMEWGGCRLVNHPLKELTAYSKPAQLQLASRMLATESYPGVRLPRTCMTSDPNEVLGLLDACGQIISKSFGPGPSTMTRQPDTKSVTRDQIVQKQELVRLAPAIYQELVPKKSDVRVTIVGDKVFACELDSQLSEIGRVDWRLDTSSIPHRACQLAPNVEKFCLDLVQALDLSFATVDLINTTSEDVVFLECTPNGQWLWIERRVPELRIADALINLLVS